MKRGFLLSWLWLFVAWSVNAQTPYVSKIDTTFCPGNKIVLVSWNTGNFGKSKSEGELAYMAKLLRNADLVVLEEVSAGPEGPKAVSLLVGYLNCSGKYWDYTVSPATHKSGSSERYAFLWRQDKLWPKGEMKEVALVEYLANDMSREPGRMVFQVFGGHEFAVYAFHLAPTDKNPLAEAKVYAIAGDDKEFANLVMLGDFNLSHVDLLGPFETGLSTKHRIEGKTSLKMKKDETGNYFSQSYDNIFTRGIEPCYSAILNFVPDWQTVKEAREISDHLPVFIFFPLSELKD